MQTEMKLNVSDRPNSALVRRSKKLSWLLRHGATDEGLPMDEAGWVPIHAVLEATGLTLPQLEDVVARNDKRRLELRSGLIRACQGHSIDNAAVTLEGLEASWARHGGDTPIWHGTSISALRSIADRGLEPISRTHVHCAASLESKVGKRAAVAVMLKIDVVALRAAGQEVFVAPNGVVLVRRVPANCIVHVVARTRKASAALPELRAMFGWESPPEG